MSSIKCPNCQTSIDIDQVLYDQLESQAKAKLAQEIAEHRKKYKAALDKLKEKELFIKEQEQKLELKAKEMAKDLLQKEIAKEKQKLEAKIKAEQETLINSLQAELKQKSDQVKKLYEAEATIEKLKLEKEEIAHKERLKAQQELHEKLQKERENLRQAVIAEVELKLKEKDIQLEQLKKQLDEAHKKAQQSSQQLQGEAQEILIEEWLKVHFPKDTIEEIKKGVRGGDCLHIVNDDTMPKCGTIYYESKRTKEFQRSWIEKLKSDMRSIGADIGVIVTEAMPKEMERMGLIDGIWICSFEEFKALSLILREHIVKLAFAKKSQENRSDKMVLLYNYLTSNEFKMQIEAIVESFSQMQEDLEKEKRAIQRIWKQREKQIQKILESTTFMYGAIKGIAGNAIGDIKSLELPYEEE